MNKLVEEIIKPLLEDTKIKKVVGIFGGRFQPFGPHHKKVYEWLASQFDDAYITTSNIKKLPRHPMNFKEKVRHMTKMGIPANKIIQEKTPFVAKALQSKFDADTTAFVYIFGKKDTGRLAGGKYFQDYKKNKKNLKGFEEHGYYLVAPHMSVSAGGLEVSGTAMRELLGSEKYKDNREKLFKKMFGYYDKGIFNMMTNKFSKIFESEFEFEPKVMIYKKSKWRKKHDDPKYYDNKDTELLQDITLQFQNGYPSQEAFEEWWKAYAYTFSKNRNLKTYRAEVLNKLKGLREAFKLPIEIGDTVLMGKFKNKKVVVKTIGINAKGDLTINGKSASKFRLVKKPNIFEVSSQSGYSADPGEPDSGFTAPGKKRIIGKDAQPDLWFSGGGYEQLQFPEADDAYGKEVDNRIKITKTLTSPEIEEEPIESDDFTTVGIGEKGKDFVKALKTEGFEEATKVRNSKGNIAFVSKVNPKYHTPIDDEEDEEKKEKPVSKKDEKKTESSITKDVSLAPASKEEQQAVDNKLSKRVTADLDFITEDADKFLENSNKEGAGSRTATLEEVKATKVFAEKRRDQNNARKKFIESNPTDEEIQLYDEMNPPHVHPACKSAQREISDEALDKSKQYLKDKMGEKKYKELNDKLANSGGWQRGGFKYTAEEKENRASELLRQYLKNGGRCAVTGEKVRLSDIEPDHRIPLSSAETPERAKELDNPRNNIDMITGNVNQFKSDAEGDTLVHKARKELYREEGGIRERKKREAEFKNARRKALKEKYDNDFKDKNLRVSESDIRDMDKDEIKALVVAHNESKGMVVGSDNYNDRIKINVKQRTNKKTGTTGGGSNRLSIKKEQELVINELKKQGYNVPSDKELNEEAKVVDNARQKIKKQTLKDSIEILKYKINNEKYSDSAINKIKVSDPDAEEKDLLTPERTKSSWKKKLAKLETELKGMGEVFTKNWWKNIINEIIVKKSKLKTRRKELLLMGGAYGHMSHPFDDKNLTFGDLKQIITDGLGGQLNREDGVTEKLDGQNLMISWKKDKLIIARNKGHIKNFGKTALSVSGIKSKFEGRGDIADAFGFAVTDLSKAIGGLSQKQKDKVFNEGQHWMNLEVMWPASANVIDYDVAEIVFHGALKYDKSGSPRGEVKGSARMLAGMIKQINQHIQKKYSIGKPNFLTLSKHQDFSKLKDKFLGKLQKLQNEFALQDSDTLGLYHQYFWEEYIYNAGQQFGYTVPDDILQNLTKRWAFFDKSYKIPTIKSDLKDESEFLEWVLKTDKNNHTKMVKENMKPFETLFFEVGAEILKNISGYIAANPDSAVQKVKVKVDKAISDVRSGGDLKKLNKLKLQLDKLNAIGGLNAIVPSEGIVFKYKGKTYKFTGAFAPVNQITGLISF